MSLRDELIAKGLITPVEEFSATAEALRKKGEVLAARDSDYFKGPRISTAPSSANVNGKKKATGAKGNNKKGKSRGQSEQVSVNVKQAKQSGEKTGRTNVCPLCGTSVPYGEMLAHKAKMHGEKMYTASPPGKHSSSQWVQVVQGGLPGLGKNHR